MAAENPVDMDVEISPTEAVLNTLSQADRATRFEFLKQLLACFPEEEIEGLKGLFGTTLKRMKRKMHAGVEAQEETKKKKDEKVGTKLKAPEYNSLSPASSSRSPSPWHSNYLPQNIFALDVEFVTLKKKVNGKGRNQAASVTIVNFDGEIEYQAVVKYNREDINITRESKLINNLDYEHFEAPDCIEYNKVCKSVAETLYGAEKLVIVLAGRGDFESLNLNMGDYNCFDLQQYYKLWTGTSSNGQPLEQVLSLATIYYDYFKINLNTEPHSDEYDAKATMRIFKEKSLPLNEIYRVRPFETTEDFELHKKMKILPSRLKYLRMLEIQRREQEKNQQQQPPQLQSLNKIVYRPG